jgi:antitoxin component HigA of HigAB toxin-antitoxin module
LGEGAFVEKVLKDADEKVHYQFTADGRRNKIAAVIQAACDQKGINEKELRMGSRRGQISTVRSDIARRLVKEYGIPLAEVARQVGVTTSAISNMLRRARGIS